MARPLDEAVSSSGKRRRGGSQSFSFALIDLANCLALYLLLPYWLYMAIFRGKYREGILERLGWLHPGPVRAGGIWIHGVSVGEILAARRMITRLHEIYPERQIVISTTTNTGQEVARREFPGYYVFYYPFDISSVLMRVLTRLRPSLLVLLELEVWPNLLRLAESRNLPVVVVNGRLSPRSYSFYRRFGRFRLGFFNRVARYGVQVEEYARRMRRLGIESDRVIVTGSLKYDTVPAPPSIASAQRARERLGLAADAGVVVLGSTHPSEARPLAEVISRLRARYPELEVVWVPRHPGRAGVVIEALAAEDLTGKLLTDIDNRNAEWRAGDVRVGNTVGELASFYAIATIVFVGKSLGSERGGQNMLEPAALGKPVVVGKHARNFRMEVEFLTRRGGLVVVEDADELSTTFDLWLSNPESGIAIGAAAATAVTALAGGTERTIELIREVLDASEGRLHTSCGD